VRLVAALLALGLAGPAAQDGPAPNGESFALLHGLARAGKLEFSVPEGPARAAAERLAKRVGGGRHLTARVLAEGEARSPEAVRVLVGSPSDDELRELARRAGIEPLALGFRAFGRDYTAPGDAAVATF
jgi:hypothetical protein